MLTAINRSVRYKVLAVVLATTLVALLVSAAALITYEAQAHRDFLISDAVTQADILGRTAAPALQFDDPATAAETLALLASRRGIIAAAIYTPTGEVFARYLRTPDVVLPPLESPTRTRFTNGYLELFHPIMANDRLIGSVYLRATDDLAARMQDYAVILGLVMLASLGVAALISAYLQRSVTGPVLAVTRVARRVMTERDFSLRADKLTEDEVGVLVDSFNAMLAEVGAITDTLEATNQRLREETDERRSAEAALRLADERKDEFLATLAHELRNPLAPMVNALWIMEAAGPGADTTKAREIIRRQLDHMVRLIDDLLDVSRITRGKLSIQMSTVELGGVIQNAVDTARPFIDAQKHTLEVRLPDEPIHLRGDAVRLSQVFSNLLDNAAKYTPQGGHIQLAARRVGARGGLEVDGVENEGRDDAVLEVVVSDDGIGMTPETLAHVFDMFVQGAEPGAVQAGLGVGLGLAKRLVDMHGGSIEAISPGPGQGSRFTVRLPLAAAPAGEPAKERPDGAAALAPGHHRILLVDDNADFVDSMALLLRSLGHRVEVAYDGRSALEVARNLEPDVAFLDLGLPELDGYQLAIELRRSPATAETLMVAISGWGQDKDRQRSRECGFAAHLVKPVDVEKVRSVLDSLATTS